MALLAAMRPSVCVCVHVCKRRSKCFLHVMPKTLDRYTEFTGRTKVNATRRDKRWRSGAVA